MPRFAVGAGVLAVGVAATWLAVRFGAAASATTVLFAAIVAAWVVAILAQKFWRGIIRELTNGDFEEQWSVDEPRGPVQVFNDSQI